MEKEVVTETNIERGTSPDSSSVPTPPVSKEDGGHDRAVGYDVKATKRLIRKIDLMLIPFLALLYL